MCTFPKDWCEFSRNNATELSQVGGDREGAECNSGILAGGVIDALEKETAE